MPNTSFTVHLLLGLSAGLFFVATAPAANLTVTPNAVVFKDAYAGRQLLVAEGERDVTRAARYASSNPTVLRVDSRGYLSPVGDGAATVAITHGGAKVSVAVKVSGCQEGRAVDFKTEIVPLLSRLGCNAGGCHGKASGQNGFRLSLFGFDTAFDHEAITREARGRRVFPAAPAQSLLLLKATGQMPHGGGKRLRADGEEYRLLRRWIEAGTPASAPGAASVVRLRVMPTDRVLRRGHEQQLAIVAEYRDGSSRDVTRQAEYFSNLDVVATVDGDGLVEARQQSGEAAVMARYRGYVAVFRAIVPHGEPLTPIPGLQANNYIDELAAGQMEETRSACRRPLADDATFLRRVTHRPVRPAADRRRGPCLPGRQPRINAPSLIDRLLESPDYPAYFALRWGSILRNSQPGRLHQAAYAFHNWIKDMIARNRPYDEFVRGIVAAAGEWQDAPAINWYWQSRDDQLHQVTADTAQVFLGVRLQCARCHHHPYERWGQDDYYGLAGFFTRLGRKSFGEPPPYFASSNVTTGEKNPLHRQDARAEVSRWCRGEVHAGTGSASRPGGLDGAAGQPVLRPRPGQSNVGPLPRPRSVPRGGRHARQQPAVQPRTARRPRPRLRQAQV